MCTFALGGDTGGSIRIPSSCCGIVGLRPTPDRVPSEEVDVTVLQSRGPMTRSVADARFLFSVMTATEPPPRTSKGRRRVGVTWAGADASCAEACRRAADALQSAGHEVEEIEWNPAPVTEGYAVVRRASMASFPADLSTFGPGIQKLAAEGRSLTAMDYFHAFEKATDAANRAVAVPLQTRYDFLLTPTLGLPPMKIGEVPPFLGEAWSRYVQFVLPVTFARSPAISIPAGLNDGLPTGVQLVGQFAQEYDLLDFAEELERMAGFGFQRPPGLD
jgi:amidase